MQAIAMFAEVTASDTLIAQCSERVRSIRFKNPYSNKRQRNEAIERIMTDQAMLIKGRNQKLEELIALQKDMKNPPIHIVDNSPPPNVPKDNSVPTSRAVPKEVPRPAIEPPASVA